MTNEMLADFIQKGDNDELIPILWQNVQKLVYCQCDKQYRLYGERFKKCGVDVWDIKQACYNAFLKAIQGFKVEQGYKFTSYLNKPMQTATAELLGIRTTKRDLLNDCTSLDKPVTNSDGDNLNLADIIADMKSTDFIEVIEDNDLSQMVWNIVDELEERQRTVIIQIYRENKTLEEIADTLSVSRERVRQIKSKSFRELRKNKALRMLANEYNSHNRWLSLSRFESSPQYFDAINHLKERKAKGEFISYGTKQSYIHTARLKYDSVEHTDEPQQAPVIQKPAYETLSYNELIERYEPIRKYLGTKFENYIQNKPYLMEQILQDYNEILNYSA